MSDIKAISFDYGGVLAEEGFREGLAAIARAQGLDAGQVCQAGMDAVYDSGFVLGRGSEADFWQLMRKRTGLKGTDASLSKEILARFRLRPWMLRLVDGLKVQGYTVGLLSDQTEWIYRLDERDSFLGHFDYVYISYKLGKGKRDMSLFADIVSDLGLQAEQILFVDDNADNVRRAISAGLCAIQYQQPEDLLMDLKQVLTGKSRGQAAAV